MRQRGRARGGAGVQACGVGQVGIERVVSGLHQQIRDIAIEAGLVGAGRTWLTGVAHAALYELAGHVLQLPEPTPDWLPGGHGDSVEARARE